MYRFLVNYTGSPEGDTDGLSGSIRWDVDLDQSYDYLSDDNDQYGSVPIDANTNVPSEDGTFEASSGPYSLYDIDYSAGTIDLFAPDDVTGGDIYAGYYTIVSTEDRGDDADNFLNGTIRGDLLIGYDGDDRYFVDNALDQVFERPGEGQDTIEASVSYTLQAGQEVETLELARVTGGRQIFLTGNEFAQTLRGNSGANVLNGGGGADAMYGLAGDDVYAVDNAGDQVFEAKGEGNDLLVTTVSYTLAAGQEVETLQFAKATGGKQLFLTGNEFGQTLRGNAGANVLDGQGGADQLYGGAGDDVYAVDNGGDRVFEAAGQGKDMLVTTISYALAAGQEVETMQFAKSTGTKNLSMEGNEFGQLLMGNAGANGLNGKLGNDTLKGGAGADTFVFSTALGPDNVDHIVDFATEDTIRLAKSIFSALAPGALSASAFKDLGAAGAVVDADDRIVYDHRTGVLAYDADGSGKGAAVAFAILDNKAALTHADILVA